MGFELEIFKRAGEDELAADYVEWLVDEQSANIQRHFGRLWEYYANPIIEASGLGTCERKVNESGRCYVQAQEYGLPARITGLLHLGNEGVLGARPVKDIQRKEGVIEND